MLNRILFACFLVFAGSPLLAQPSSETSWDLRRCLEYALENNLSLQQAQLNLESNGIELERNRASRYPNLNAGFGFGSNFGYTVNPFTNEFTSQGIQSLNGGIQSNITVYQFGRITQSITQAEVNQQVSRLDLHQAEYDLMLNVTLAYLDIIRNQELVKSAEIQVGSTRQQRDRTARLVEAGSLPRADLLQIEAQIATDELNLLNTRNQLETAFLTLMQLLQLDPAQPFGIQAVEAEIPVNDIFELEMTEIYAIAEGTMPSVASADLQVRSAQLGENIAKTGLLPSISASGSVGTGWASGRSIPSGRQITILDTASVFASLGGSAFQEIRLANSFVSPEFVDYSFGNQVSDNINASFNLSLNIPIYNRFQNEAAIQQAGISRKQAELTALQERQRLEQTIQQAYVQARSAYGTYTSTQKQLTALELAFQNTERQFNLGAANSLEYLVAKNNLERARNDLVQAKYAYLFRAKVLDFYQGKPLDSDE